MSPVVGDGRLCGKVGGADYTGHCLHCGEYHGEWYTGFKSLEELEAWRAANVSPEDREQARLWREEYDQRIRQGWRETAIALGVADVEAFVELGAGKR